MTWNEYLLEYYAARIAQETRPEALQFLRATYSGLKNPNHDILQHYPNCFLFSRPTFIRTDGLFSANNKIFQLWTAE